MNGWPELSRALTLAERGALFESPPSDGPPVDVDDSVAVDYEAARTRVEQWRREGRLEDDERFALRLEQDGLDVERFTRLLGCSPPPAVEQSWTKTLAASFADRRASDSSMPVDAILAQDDAVLVAIVQPLLDHGWWQLRSALSGLDAGAVDLSTFARLWAEPLPAQLLQMVIKTLMLELFVHKYEGSLGGDTPEARFDSFIERYRGGEGARELWARYPVLARAMAERVEQWLEVGLEFARRYIADLPELATSFAGGRSLGELVALKPGLGDRHAGGRTVASLEFSSGVKVVYKPRSLKLDVVFQELVIWLGEQGVKPALRTLRLLPRTNYGWVEFVDEAACQDAEAVRRFYQRQGIYLALLYALEATDFHHENLIASGEHPVLIDLETLFQPNLVHDESSREDRNPVASTILRSGLLPRHAWGEQGAEGVDLSGLGASRDQLTAVRRLTRIGTDEMAFVDDMAEMPMGKHLPSLSGQEIELWKYQDVILGSFESTYQTLSDLRQSFLDPGGWLDRFAGLETRVVVRPTGLYVRLLNFAYHPDHLQDALQRDRLYEKLWLDAERFDYVLKVIPFERRDMWRGDVPHFTSRTDSRDLYSSSGERLSDVLPGSGLELARERFNSLSAEDLERQLALARLSFVAVRPPEAAHAPELHRSVVQASVKQPFCPQDALAAAARAGRHLEVLSFRFEEWISWFHLRPNAENRQVLEPVGPDLYSGLGGIAIFFGALGAHGPPSSCDKFTQLAQAALATGRNRFESDNLFGSKLGGYSGLGGWIYVLTYLAALWRRDELFDEAESVCDQVAPLVDADQSLDLIGGAAGCIGALLALHHHRPSRQVLSAAVACGEHLVRRAEAQDVGYAWRIPDAAELPLTGFAHGAAGIAWALARLASVSGREDFAEAARGGMAYERHLFSVDNDNWPDLRYDRRSEGGDWGYFNAWCHGAPGIGLSRLDLLDHFEGDSWSRAQREDEIRAAVRSTLAGGFGENHCLCHGDLGNLELVQRAAIRLDDGEMRQSADAMGGRILGGLDQVGYRCGIRSRVALPGLLTGIAGIGYGLLRLASPSTIPSVLLFETPD